MQNKNINYPIELGDWCARSKVIAQELYFDLIYILKIQIKYLDWILYWGVIRRGHTEGERGVSSSLSDGPSPINSKPSEPTEQSSGLTARIKNRLSGKSGVLF